MKRKWLGACLTAALVAATVAMPAQAAVFDFNFDTTPNSTVTPPFAGTGTFSFNGPAAVGTYALTSLSGFAFDFTVGGVNFTNADLATPQNNILVQISASGLDLVVNFGGAGGGPFGGSADFVDAGNGLSFQPSFGSLYFSTSSGLGTYVGVLETGTVPEPVSVGLAAIGLAGLAAARRRRR